VFKPNIAKLEERAAADHRKQPGVYLSKQKRYGPAVYAAYNALINQWERENYPSKYEGAQEKHLWQFRKQYYEQFLLNCSNYLVTMMVNDKFIAQDENNQVTLVRRRQ